ncbi:hypothetical protein BFN10_02315 [Pseudomonas extremorientalis]|uniref:Uncharacterized protein n=2 Tax=Pseudomonas extremorientalis TaxID=169669 RepID=A0A1S2TRH6_9PSED|nr:hypothetical protein BFN10_02315 [Pseudomonas extremorientalis]
MRAARAEQPFTFIFWREPMSTVNHPTPFLGANALIESIIGTIQGRQPTEQRPLTDDQKRVLEGKPVAPDSKITY